jgi:hypothetical protein
MRSFELRSYDFSARTPANRRPSEVRGARVRDAHRPVRGRGDTLGDDLGRRHAHRGRTDLEQVPGAAG